MDMSVADSITTLVEYALPRFSPADKLFHLTVGARMDIHDDDEPGRSSRMIHFLFQRPGNYTKVFVAMEDYAYRVIADDDSRNWKRSEWVKLKDGLRAFHASELNNLHWRMTCDHDSCWRSDGVQSVLHEIRQHMMAEVTGGDNSRCKEVSHYNNICSFHQPEFIQAEVVVDEEANNLRSSGSTYIKKPINMVEWEI